MQTTETRVTYRITQAGEVVHHFHGVEMVLLGNMVGTVGDVPCFKAVRFVDVNDRRRAMDKSTRELHGPATVEVLNESGDVIAWIGIATAYDVADHPRGELAVR